MIHYLLIFLMSLWDGLDENSGSILDDFSDVGFPKLHWKGKVFIELNFS